jgi:hypothetical protein
MGAAASGKVGTGAELCWAALENTVPVVPVGNCICDAVDAGKVAD